MGVKNQLWHCDIKMVIIFPVALKNILLGTLPYVAMTVSCSLQKGMHWTCESPNYGYKQQTLGFTLMMIFFWGMNPKRKLWRRGWKYILSCRWLFGMWCIFWVGLFSHGSSCHFLVGFQCQAAAGGWKWSQLQSRWCWRVTRLQGKQWPGHWRRVWRLASDPIL